MLHLAFLSDFASFSHVMLCLLLSPCNVYRPYAVVPCLGDRRSCHWDQCLFPQNSFQAFKVHLWVLNMLLFLHSVLIPSLIRFATVTLPLCNRMIFIDFYPGLTCLLLQHRTWVFGLFFCLSSFCMITKPGPGAHESSFYCRNSSLLVFISPNLLLNFLRTGGKTDTTTSYHVSYSLWVCIFYWLSF